MPDCADSGLFYLPPHHFANLQYFRDFRRFFLAVGVGWLDDRPPQPILLPKCVRGQWGPWGGIVGYRNILKLITFS